MDAGNEFPRKVKAKRTEAGFSVVGSIWAICLLDPILFALDAARHSNTGFLGYALAVVIGVLFGVGSSWGWMMGIGFIILAVTIGPPERMRLRQWLGAVQCFAALPWICVVSVLVEKATSAFPNAVR